MKYIVSLCAAMAAGTLLAAGSVVKIEGGEGAWHLTLNGKPYFIRGGGGGGSKALLKAIGGNSFRTWGADHAKQDLEEAQKYGLTVMIGFWLGHPKHGFDYTNEKALYDTEKSILKTVRENKDHPSLLCWSLGNEMELGNPHPVEMWKFINQLAIKVKAIDPNHPVCTVVADVWPEKAKQIVDYAQALDFIGFNTYGGGQTVGRRWRECGGNKPYALTEYGPLGASDMAKTSFGVPLEWTSTKKIEWYKAIYEKTILADSGKYCLGGYVFTWGTKNEASPTWFGTLLPDGTKLGVTELLADLWKHPLKNKCPRIEDIVISKDDLAEGETVAASVSATDPEGDKLTWKWTLVEEANFYGEAGLGLAMPEGYEEAIVAGQGTPNVRVKLPGGGKFRLYAYCFDGKGNAAYANHPMRGAGKPPKKELRPESIPCAVYKDGAPRKWYASGYMGNNGALKLEDNCEEMPHSGATCLKVTYSANNNWAGVMWQSPANDWGNAPGGFNLSNANTLVFWARGAAGGEKVKFFCGGLNKSKFKDTGAGTCGEITLKKNWTRYRIPLDGEDLSCIKTGFGFSFGANRPITFYLDDIEYISQ